MSLTRREAVHIAYEKFVEGWSCSIIAEDLGLPPSFVTKLRAGRINLYRSLYNEYRDRIPRLPRIHRQSYEAYLRRTAPATTPARLSELSKVLPYLIPFDPPDPARYARLRAITHQQERMAEETAKLSPEFWRRRLGFRECRSPDCFPGLGRKRKP